MVQGGAICWVCESPALDFVRRSNLPSTLSSRNFEITDYNYGTTGEIFRCRRCGFMLCPSIGSVRQHYELMEDPAYEDGREGRRFQARQLLEHVRRIQYADGVSGKRLLDVGAGSGFLVEEAAAMGFDAYGIEPSRWLCERARLRGITLRHGTLDQVAITDRYDLITVVDVIEHVDLPVELLRSAANLLARGGILLIVTPDVRSLAARLLRWRWWHFRIAHVGYFSHHSLDLACRRAGLAGFHAWRPRWYFEAGYVWKRGLSYAPRFLRVDIPPGVATRRVPINLHDSIALLARRLDPVV